MASLKKQATPPTAKKVKKYLSITDLDDILEGTEQVWVMINPDRAGDVTKLVLTLRSPTTGRLQNPLNIDHGVPVNLTALKSRTVLANCDDLKQHVASGVLRLLAPEYARELNKSEDIVERRQALRDLKHQQEAIRNEANSEMASETKGKIDINPVVTTTMSLLTNGGIAETAALAKLRTVTLNQRDLLAVVSQAGDSQKIRQWAQAQIEALGQGSMAGDIGRVGGNRPETSTEIPDDSPSGSIRVPRITNETSRSSGGRKSAVKSLLGA